MKRVLFIGNSFTFYNDLPAALTQLCNAVNFPIETTGVLKGGWYLSRFADPQNEMGIVLRQEYPRQNWDFIVLQDQSLNPAKNPADFLAASRSLCQMMHCQDSFVFYQTWAYADDSEKLRSTGYSYNEMQERLQSSYRQASQENHALLAPVGDAFRRCYELYPKISLICPDHYHPTPCGTYLAACVFFATLSGKSPLILPATQHMDVSCLEKSFGVPVCDTIGEEDARVLRQIAHDVTQPLHQS